MKQKFNKLMMIMGYKNIYGKWDKTEALYDVLIISAVSIVLSCIYHCSKSIIAFLMW